MSVHQETMQALIEMGIEAPKARAAALRFTKTDAAVNWCFSDGMDVSNLRIHGVTDLNNRVIELTPILVVRGGRAVTAASRPRNASCAETTVARGHWPGDHR